MSALRPTTTRRLLANWAWFVVALSIWIVSGACDQSETPDTFTFDESDGAEVTDTEPPSRRCTAFRDEASNCRTSDACKWRCGSCLPDSLTVTCRDTSADSRDAGDTRGGHDARDAEAGDLRDATPDDGQTADGDVDAGAEPPVTWVDYFGEEGFDVVEEATVDASGHLYVAGLTSTPIRDQTVDGKSDAFLAQFHPSGTLEWIRLVGGEFELERGRGVATTPFGPVYVGWRRRDEEKSFVTAFTKQGEYISQYRVGDPGEVVRLEDVTALPGGSVVAVGELVNDATDAGGAFVESITPARSSGGMARRWRAVRGGPGDDHVFAAAPRVTSQGARRVVVLEARGRSMASRDWELQLTEFARDGQESRLTTLSSGKPPLDFYWAYDLESTPSGLLVSGAAAYAPQQVDALMGQFDFEGREQFLQTYDRGGNEFAVGLHPSDNGLRAGGMVDYREGDDGPQGRAAAASLGDSGGIQELKAFGGPNIQVRASAASPDGAFYVVGRTTTAIGGVEPDWSIDPSGFVARVE